MAISLSSGVRQSLQSLQSTAVQAQTAQQRLATGKRVNSAIDNPVNFFTASALNNRAEAFSGLLDSISNTIQTIKSASNGIDGITKLVKSLQSTVKQAQSDAATNKPAKTGSALATDAEVTATGKDKASIALDKLVYGTAAAATSSSVGNLGATTATNAAISITSGNTTYSAALTPGTATLRDVVNEINKSGLATASVDSNGKLNVVGSGSSTLKIGIGSSATSAAAAITDAQAGGGNTALGLLAADASTGISATGNSTVRASLVSQYNDVRTQLDQLAKDSGFNGTNLLAGDKLKVVFNEKTGANQSKLDVQGSKISSDNLGIQDVRSGGSGSNLDLQNDADLATADAALTNALSSLTALSSTLGASLSVVQTRQDFSKSLIDTLKIGADNLVNADTNEEGANLLALQTRQSLAQTALSLSAQTDQSVLKLF